MIAHDRSFPHPVLSPFRDDVTPNRFDFDVAVSSDADTHYLQAAFEYNNETLSSLIEQGAARHSVHVECRRNFYREMFHFAEQKGQVALSALQVSGRVEVSGFITATRALSGYRVAGSHADYGTASFDVQAGDVLAVGRSLYCDAFVDYDPLTSVSSILNIRRSETIEEGPMTVETDADQILATLSRQDYDRYTNLKSDPTIAPLLANQIMVPILVEALDRMKGSGEDEHDEAMQLRWYRSVIRKLHEHGIDIRGGAVSGLQATQALLGLPVRRSLHQLLSLTAIGDEP